MYISWLGVLLRVFRLAVIAVHASLWLLSFTASRVEGC